MFSLTFLIITVTTMSTFSETAAHMYFVPRRSAVNFTDMIRVVCLDGQKEAKTSPLDRCQTRSDINHISNVLSNSSVFHMEILMYSRTVCCRKQLEEDSCTAGRDVAKFKSNLSQCILEPNSKFIAKPFEECCTACFLTWKIIGRYDECATFPVSYNVSMESCCANKSQYVSGHEDLIQDRPSLKSKPLKWIRDNLPPPLSTLEDDVPKSSDCPVGFALDVNSKSCVDVNECVSHSQVCPVGYRCDNTVGSFECFREATCGTGYTWNSHLKICQDNDECRSGTNPCGVNSICQNTRGSYRCISLCPEKRGRGNFFASRCPPGKKWNSTLKSMEDVNECQSNPCGADSVCVNLIGSYRCDCRAGYTKNQLTGNCQDINECDSPSVCDQICMNIPGSFKCQCKRGYRLSYDFKTCVEDKPEGLTELCQEPCSTPVGSIKWCGDAKVLDSCGCCTDIDECTSGVHRCSANEVCINKNRGHKCIPFKCPDGYRQLRPELRNCYKERCDSQNVTCKTVTGHNSFALHYKGIGIRENRKQIFSKTFPRYRFANLTSAIQSEDIFLDVKEKSIKDHFALKKMGQDVKILVMKSFDLKQNITIDLIVYLRPRIIEEVDRIQLYVT